MSSRRVSPFKMPGFPRRRPLGAVAAESLLAGRGLAPGAPAGQQALARVLATAGNAVSEEELADEAAYVALFLLAISEAEAAAASRSRVRRGLALLTLAVATGVMAVGSTAAYTGELPTRLQELAHVTFGAPAPHHNGPPASRLSTGRRSDVGGTPAGLPIPQPPPAGPATPARKTTAATPGP